MADPVAEPPAEPSSDPVDVTRVPLAALRSPGLAEVARRTAADLVGGKAGVQAQQMDQYDPD